MMWSNPQSRHRTAALRLCSHAQLMLLAHRSQEVCMYLNRGFNFGGGSRLAVDRKREWSCECTAARSPTRNNGRTASGMPLKRYLPGLQNELVRHARVSVEASEPRARRRGAARWE